MNGYRFHCDIARLYDRLLVHKPLFQEMANRATIRFVANRAVFLFDSSQMSEKTVNAYSEAIGNLQQEFSRADSGRRALIDYDSSVVLFPMTGNVLAMTFIEMEDQLSLFRDIDWPGRLQPFSYTDACDPPKEVSAKDYQKRLKMWKFALGPTMVPSHRGLKFELSSNREALLHVTPEQIMDFIPSVDERAEKIVSSSNQLMKRFSGLEEFDSASQFIEIYDKFRDWLLTDEGRSEKEKDKLKVIETIKAEISLDDLIG